MTDWKRVREVWENDEREGYAWLIHELHLDVSIQAIRKHVKKEGWTKTGVHQVNQKVNREPKVNPDVNRTKETVSETVTETVSDSSALSAREKIFIGEYLLDFNATRAAKAAGYTAKSAEGAAFRLLRKDRVKKELNRKVKERADKLDMEGEDVLRAWVEIVNLDVNDIQQIRVIPCPYCYSTNGLPQYSAEDKEQEFKRFRGALMDGIGGGFVKSVKKKKDENGETQEINVGLPEFPGFGGIETLDESKKPNPNCPYCGGRGRPKVVYMDTTQLSPIARKMFGGFELVKGDIRVIMPNKEKALENLAKAFGLFREREEKREILAVDVAELGRLFTQRMKEARDRQEAVLRRRGLLDDIEDLKIMDGD